MSEASDTTSSFHFTFCTSRAQPISARTLPTSRRVFLLFTSARHDKFLKTLAITCRDTKEVMNCRWSKAFITQHQQTYNSFKDVVSGM